MSTRDPGKARNSMQLYGTQNSSDTHDGCEAQDGAHLRWNSVVPPIHRHSFSMEPG